MRKTRWLELSRKTTGRQWSPPVFSISHTVAWVAPDVQHWALLPPWFFLCHCMSLKNFPRVHVYLCAMNAHECVHTPVCVHVCAVECACMWKLEVKFGYLPCLLSIPVLWQNLSQNPKVTDLASLARQFAPEIPHLLFLSAGFTGLSLCFSGIYIGVSHLSSKPVSPSSNIFIHLNSFLKLKNGL